MTDIELLAKNQGEFVKFAENTTISVVKLAERINFVFKLSLVSTLAIVLLFVKVYIL